MNNARNFKGVWIPKEIWLCKDLTPLEKIYLVEIDSLDDEENGCFASNKHFEEMFGQKGANATRIITNLKEKGWLDISYIYNGKEIDKRIIKIKRPPYPDRYYNNYNTCYKNDNGVLYKLEEGYYKNYKDRNTLLDKQLDNNKEIKKEKSFKKPNLEEIEMYVKEKQLNVDAQQFYDYFEEGNWKDSKGNKVKNWKQKILTWNKFATKKDNKKKWWEEDE